ncbi:cobalamin biosynthesis protein CbiX [Aquabacterium lacunae]|uniref:Cobalamin biosynthesis protein CbiX n=1 Tax=Aquabacterium lacunae TaxID=2528630 RepID=A0A4Q9H3G9_9BURK|nr:CbiX/SirB N-terminal domain-containing protein [Aquabacterium lacunae]TBO34061.1 cobalamin biosynthesis protein CbiX [Aquabacterium lacunae]
MTPGILLFAHGARDPNWAIPFQRTQALLAEQPTAHGKVPVELAFLEFMQPDLIEGGDRLVKAGCTEVTVVPLFLGAGGHVRKDLPELMSQLQARHPDVAWRLAPAVGETDTLVQALARSAAELAGLTPKA